jgi:hypothetical protein
MSTTAIRPTTTSRVRRFLSEQGVDLRPWSGLDETYAHLYALLNERKGDPTFWSPLSDLLGDVINDTINQGRLPAPQAELLASWDIEDLMRDLRMALPGDDQPPEQSTVKLFLEGLSAPVLGGFLMLGLVTSACDKVEDDGNGDVDTDTDTDTDSDTDTDADNDWDANCDLDSSSILWTAINDSDLDNSDKKELCACFESLNSDWNTGLADLFQNGTPEEVASALEDMISCCSAFPEILETPYEQSTEDALITETLCSDVPIYKGVSFPGK